MTTEKDLTYYRINCKPELYTTPISVLRYIGELEKAVEQQTVTIGYTKEEMIEEIAKEALRIQVIYGDNHGSLEYQKEQARKQKLPPSRTIDIDELAGGLYQVYVLWSRDIHNPDSLTKDFATYLKSKLK